MPKGDIDLSEFEANNARQGASCAWSQMDLSDEQRSRLQAAMTTPHIQHAAIARVLKAWGFTVNADAVARHRKGECGTCR